MDLVVIGSLWDNLYLLIPVYQVFVTLLTRYGRWRADNAYVKRNDWFWIPIMFGYNIAMSIFSLVCAVIMFLVVFVRYDGIWMSQECFSISHDPLFRQVVYAFYISKYIEFADTLFLIVRGKHVSWLHWYHHSGAVLNMGLIYHSRMEAGFLFVCLNGVIHALMYFYYAATLVNVRTPWKSTLTSLQILQFLFGFSLFYRYKNLPCLTANPELVFTYIYTWIYVGVLLLFFCHFFLVNLKYIGSKID